MCWTWYFTLLAPPVSCQQSTCTSCNYETRDMLTLQTQVSHFQPLLLQVFMCSWCSSRCTSTPPPLTIVVLVSMKNVFHLRIVLRNPCSNSAVTTEPWVHHLHPKSSILFCIDLGSIYITSFMQLWSCAVKRYFFKSKMLINFFCDLLQTFIATLGKRCFWRNISWVHQESLSAIVQYSPTYPQAGDARKRSSEFCETEDSSVVFQCSYIAVGSKSSRVN